MSYNSSLPILLVDDDRDDVDITMLALKQNNIHNEVVVAKDGHQAIELLLNSDEQDGSLSPALILLDINMPGMDGMETLALLRNNNATRSLPVVMLTTSNNPDDVNKSYALGANSFINKPADFDQFCRIIGDIGKYWLAVNVVSTPQQEYVNL
jgi:two-component system, response regulator